MSALTRRLGVSRGGASANPENPAVDPRDFTLVFGWCVLEKCALFARRILLTHALCDAECVLLMRVTALAQGCLATERWIDLCNHRNPRLWSPSVKGPGMCPLAKSLAQVQKPRQTRMR